MNILTCTNWDTKYGDEELILVLYLSRNEFNSASTSGILSKQTLSSEYGFNGFKKKCLPEKTSKKANKQCSSKVVIKLDVFTLSAELNNILA